ncbi:uncharacterized protein LOC113386165 [Ctenocephalides felis]|uniref:uncharacterized protein LOC113386165 n=1 Tax=Ctenocephalides felis TaxID=7515 RepID=UPI000E6E1E83|nr:uncharacterized protein LOC113386165 [Ctenocephalides felis]
MAGKEKKPKLSESPSTKSTETPTTTPKAGGRKRRTAVSSSVPPDETSNASEMESVQSTEDDVAEEANSGNAAVSDESPTTGGKKGKTAAKNSTEEINADEAPNDETAKGTKKVAKKGPAKKKLGLVKNSIVIGKRKTALGVTVKRANRRKRRHSAGEDTKPKMLRNGKPRADSPSAKKRRPRLMSATVAEPVSGVKSLPQQAAKIEAPSSDSEVSRRRRRSDSLSKCSDTTIQVVFVTSSWYKNHQIKLLPMLKIIMIRMQIQIPKCPTKLKILDKMSQNFNTETPNDAQVIDTAKFVRRSTRQRRSVVTPTPPLIQIKIEPKEEEHLVINPMEIPLDEVSLLADPSPPILIKADSVSPEPAPENPTQRAMHVKQFYGQPAFMENNVGIESDPSLGEIITQAPVLDKEMPLVTTASDLVSENLKDDTVADIVEASMEIDEAKAYDSNTSVDVETIKDLVQTPMLTSSQEPMLISQTVDTESDVDVERLDDFGPGDISMEDNLTPSISQVSQAKSDQDLFQSTVTSDNLSLAENIKKLEVIEELQPPILVAEEGTPTDKREEVKENLRPNEKTEDVKTTDVKNIDMKKSETPPPVLVSLMDESPETLLQKESVMNALGLLTLQAADAAKQERKKQKEQRLLSQQHRGSAYTGTLKTVIKINRGGATGSNGSDKRRSRCGLKMTFQKGGGRGGAGGKHRGSDATLKDNTGDNTDGDGMYYTIQNEVMSSSGRGGRHYAESGFRESASDGGASHSSVSGNGGSQGATTTGDGFHHNTSANRKSLSRLYSTSTTYQQQSNTGLSCWTGGGDAHSFNHNSAASGSASLNSSGSGAPADATAAALVIPEKASSFSIHPGRLCRDQCHYCGGKFGLFDTPCHVAQIKSLDRQKRILEMEEKLTVDNCLCDACYRHVDRRANCPSYRKRLSNSNNGNAHQATFEDRCRVVGCREDATNTLRRKWLLKMKKNVEKINMTSQHGNIHLCTLHYDAVSHLLVCALCKRRLARNHAHYLAAAESSRASDLLRAQGIPHLGLDAGQGGSSAVCKLCRYYVGLLFKADAEGGRTSKAAFIKSYRRRYGCVHNSQVYSYESDTEDPLIQQFAPEETSVLGNKKAKTAKTNVKKSRKSTESTTDIQTENYDSIDNENKQTDAEDIENIISKNTIHINRNSDLTTNQSKQQKLNEITSQKPGQSVLLSNLSNSMHKKIRLDEILSQQQESEQLKAEKVQQLRSNPSLSVRELFPGEEEMGLHANIPLNRGGPRTPEGWTKCTTTIQYDEETRRLWNHLQEPYGNQSSFLRHLILLEKYFRSGDLVLSQNATSSATNYSESVQSRLRSFDHIPTTVNSEMPTGYNKKSIGSMQIGNMVSLAKSSSAFVKPVKKGQETSHNSAAPISALKRSSLPSTSIESPVTVALKISGNSTTNVSSNSAPTTDTSPAFVSASLAIQAAAAVTSVPTASSTTSTSQYAGTSGSSLTVVPVTGSSTTSPDAPASKEPSPTPASTQTPTPATTTLSAAEPIKKTGSAVKPWRPTLIPIDPNSEPPNPGQLFQTVDGRRLPSLVQVMSGGKPYHISIQDYNRMCILRRQKVVQMQKTQLIQKIKDAQKTDKNPTEAKNSVVSVNKKKVVDIPNKVLEQNSVIPIRGAESTKTKKTVNNATAILKNLPQISKNLTVARTTTAVTNTSISNTATITKSDAVSIASEEGYWSWESIKKQKMSDEDSKSQMETMLSKIPKSLTVIPQKAVNRTNSISPNSVPTNTSLLKNQIDKIP